MLLTISIVSAIVCFAIIIAWIISKSRKKKLPLPPESGTGWTNTAIRKFNQEGKGIR